jgi:serine/threonine-protein kinase
MLGGYRIDDIIGIGGMAIVYRAEQLSLGRPIALKVLAPQLSMDEAFRERFRREGKHVAALDHPHVLTVHDSGEIDGRLFLAMRLVDGASLAEQMQRKGLSADETLSILTPIADALDAAHSIGLVHRDVKPQNILIGQSGHPYLADFGVAKGGTATLGLTGTGGFIGSVNYASPEQIRGLAASPSGDVYALAAVLYECLTGQVPYPRDTDAGVMHAHLNEPPPKLAITASNATELDSVIARGMAKDPSARHESAGELVRAASYALAGLSVRDRQAIPAFQVPAQTVDDGLPPAALIAAADRRQPTAQGGVGHVVASGVGPPRGATEIVPVAERSARRRTANATTADQRRTPAALPAPAPARRHWRKPAPTILGVGIAAGLALLIVLLTQHGASGPVAPRLTRAHSGPLSLTYQAPWRPAAAPSPGSFAIGLPTTPPIHLGSGRASLAAGTVTRSAPIPGGVPPELVARYGQPVSLVTTKVAGEPGRRYIWNLPDGLQLVARIVPTTTADLAILCSAAKTDPSAIDACAAAASRVTLSGVQVLEPGPDTTVATALSAELDHVATAAKRMPEVSSSQLPSRSAAAVGIAHAERAGVQALGRIVLPPRNSAAVSALEAGLTTQAAAFVALSRATTAADKNSAYLNARTRIILASRRLSAAAGDLARQGFKTPSLDGLIPPGLPAPVEPDTTTSTASTPTALVTPSQQAPAPTQSAPTPAVKHQPVVVATPLN